MVRTVPRKNPRVSVIITAYNTAAYLEASVYSVVTQTERDLEMIVIDDGSTDNTLALVEGLARSDSRISLCSQQHSGKPAVARNVGLARARGEFICLLDGDDFYDSRKVERQLAVFERCPELDVVCSDMGIVGEDGDVGKARLYWHEIGFPEKAVSYVTHRGNKVYVSHDDFFRFMCTHVSPVTIHTAMFRRRIFCSAKTWFREDEDLVGAEDSEFCFRVARRSRIGFLGDVLAYYRKHEGSISSSPERYLERAVRRRALNVEEMKAALSPEELKMCRRTIAALLFDLGHMRFSRGKRREAKRAYRASMVWCLRPRTFAAYLKAFAPEWLVAKYRRGQPR